MHNCRTRNERKEETKCIAKQASCAKSHTNMTMSHFTIPSRCPTGCHHQHQQQQTPYLSYKLLRPKTETNQAHPGPYMRTSSDVHNHTYIQTRTCTNTPFNNIPCPPPTTQERRRQHADQQNAPQIQSNATSVQTRPPLPPKKKSRINVAFGIIIPNLSTGNATSLPQQSSKRGTRRLRFS